MKIIVEQKAGRDYPANMKYDKIFQENQIRQIRARLQLRPEDEVEIMEIEGQTVPPRYVTLWFWCGLCKHWHRYGSGIGQEHTQYKADAPAKGDLP